MSFEGYYKIRCANDHAGAIDVYRFDEDTMCPTCGAVIVDADPVDTTNGAEDDDND